MARFTIETMPRRGRPKYYFTSCYFPYRIDLFNTKKEALAFARKTEDVTFVGWAWGKESPKVEISSTATIVDHRRPKR